jgi:4-hydroxybenzoate polyprenyltransferase
VIRRLRVLILLSRPAVLLLLGLFAAAGLAQGGAGDEPLPLARALFVVGGFLLCSVMVNDLADEAIDRVNLPGHASRPLVTGAGTRSEFPLIAAVAATAALGASATIGWRAVVVVAAGLVLSLAYSLPPVRLSERGAVATMLLPAGYVAVPFLVGLLSVRSTPTGADLVLLAGLYLGFIGRIVLKDFRDVVGDALFGKRTFLVRHGRGWTCVCSATGWVTGSIALLGIRGVTVPLVLAQVVWVTTALVLLRALSQDRGARRDEWLISAIAVVGRGMVLTLVIHLGTTDAGWTPWAAAAALAAVVVVLLGQAVTMARHGPIGRFRVPQAWSAATVPEPASAAAAAEG